MCQNLCKTCDLPKNKGMLPVLQHPRPMCKVSVIECAFNLAPYTERVSWQLYNSCFNTHLFLYCTLSCRCWTLWVTPSFWYYFDRARFPWCCILDIWMDHPTFFWIMQAYLSIFPFLIIQSTNSYKPPNSSQHTITLLIIKWWEHASEKSYLQAQIVIL